MAERAAGAPTEGNAMTEVKRQEAGRARFLLLPPLSAAAATATATEKAVDQLGSAFARKDK
jgi:hypothetical protein